MPVGLEGKMIELWLVVWITTVTGSSQFAVATGLDNRQHFEFFNDKKLAVQCMLDNKAGARIFNVQEFEFIFHSTQTIPPIEHRHCGKPMIKIKNGNWMCAVSGFDCKLK